MKIPAPKNLRQTFQIFQLYRSDTGTASLVDELDWTGVTPAQVYFALLGRLPENRDIALAEAGYSPSVHFSAILESSEFQDKFIENFVNAFPEKPRNLFVHIPKCAGMDLEFDLGEKFPSLPQALTIPHMTSRKQLRETMATLATEINFSEALFVNGHIPIKWYIDHGVYRIEDNIFSIVRQPVNIVFSWVNYIATILLADLEVERIDTAEWLAILGEARLPREMSEADRIALCRRILHNHDLVQPNYICSYLGTGTVESTIDMLALSNIEIVDISRYPEWRMQVWGMGEGARRNQSSPIITPATIPSSDYEYILDITTEDRLFYGQIARLLLDSPTPSIRGLDIARVLESP